MIAVPMTFLLCAGGIDLSLGAATSFGGVVCGKALKAGCSIPVAILLALAVGLLIGLMNGVCIVKFKLPGFILTLGTQYCLNGIINVWTSGLSISNFAKEYTRIGQLRIGKVVPIPIVYAVIIALIGHIILTRSKLGRKILAVGGNEETARLAGINVDKMKILTYVFVSVMACFAGVIYGARFAAVQPAIGTGSEMNIIAAVIVGGTSMMGGVGTIVGTVIDPEKLVHASHLGYVERLPFLLFFEHKEVHGVVLRFYQFKGLHYLVTSLPEGRAATF